MNRPTMESHEQLRGIYAGEAMPERIHAGDDGYNDTERMLRTITSGWKDALDFDLLVMPTMNPQADIPEEHRDALRHGLTSGATWFTHKYSSSEQHLRSRLQEHNLAAHTIRRLVKARRKGKHPCIIQVYCEGYVWPFMWYKGMDTRAMEDWLEDIDYYCNAIRLVESKENGLPKTVVMKRKKSAPRTNGLQAKAKKQGRQIMRGHRRVKRRTAWALWCGDCLNVYTQAKNYEPLTSTPAATVEEAQVFLDGYQIEGSKGWAPVKDSMKYGSSQLWRRRWLLAHPRHRKLARRLQKEYQDAEPGGDAFRIVDQMVSGCPACDSGHQEAARRHADYWLNKAEDMADDLIFYAQTPKQIPIMDVESLEPMDLKIIRHDDL